MYERFTDRARMVMKLAEQESLARAQSYVGTDHLLLGLLTEGNGVAANVIKNLGGDLKQVRTEVEKRVASKPDTDFSAYGQPTSAQHKKVIERAMEEARNFGHNYVGTEHILLGLLREEEGNAGHSLMTCGVTLEDARKEIVAILGRPLNRSSSENRPPD